MKFQNEVTNVKSRWILKSYETPAQLNNYRWNGSKIFAKIIYRSEFIILDADFIYEITTCNFLEMTPEYLGPCQASMIKFFS